MDLLFGEPFDEVAVHIPLIQKVTCLSRVKRVRKKRLVCAARLRCGKVERTEIRQIRQLRRNDEGMETVQVGFRQEAVFRCRIAVGIAIKKCGDGHVSIRSRGVQQILDLTDVIEILVPVPHIQAHRIKIHLRNTLKVRSDIRKNRHARLSNKI